MYGDFKFSRVLSVAPAFGLALLFLAVSTDPAWATVIGPTTTMGTCGSGTIGGVVACLIQNSQDSHALLPALSYLFGLVIGAMAIAKLVEHISNPHQVSVWEPIKRALAAGCLFALPLLIEAVYVTLTNGSSSGLIVNVWTGSPTGGGLDAMVAALMNDAYKPMANLIMMFCYFAGIILVIVGITRLLKSAQEGPRGPGGFGTTMTFLVARARFSGDALTCGCLRDFL